MRWLAVDGAADALGSSENLLDGTGQGLGERFRSHLAGNIDDLVKRDVARVFDVLLLLPVARRLYRMNRSECWSHVDSGWVVPLRALITRAEAVGTTSTLACRFWIVSWTVTRKPFQAPVALAISSPTFLGD